jgi:hypothetical protein
MALGFNDLRPRPEPKAAKTTLPETDEGRNVLDEGRQGHAAGSVARSGHIRQECKLKKKDKEKTAETEEACKPQQVPVVKRILWLHIMCSLAMTQAHAQKTG